MKSEIYFDPDGNAYRGKNHQDILLKWARDFEAGGPRRFLACTQLRNFEISTIWLGMDHNIGGPVPLIYESMVFDEKHEELDCYRYSSKALALQGHKEIVERLKGMLK